VVAAADRGVARAQLPDDGAMRISHETIYLSLFVQTRGALRRELTAHLRSGHVTRRPQGRELPSGRGQITDKVMISERPAEADDRAVPGHWEGDLLLGKLPTAILTLVERSSRFTQLVALPDGRKAEPVRVALTASIATLPEQLRRSLTWDQGKEMAEHAQFSIDSDLRVYFCDPRSPWQRGSNEPAAPVLPPQEQPRRHASPPGRGRRPAQRPAAQDAEVDDAGREARRAHHRRLSGPTHCKSRDRSLTASKSQSRRTPRAPTAAPTRHKTPYGPPRAR
jgi:hypothetical protein